MVYSAGGIYVASLIGLLMTGAAVFITHYYTSTSRSPVRKIADLLLDLVGHPVGHEPLQPRSCAVDHPQSGVLGTRHAGCCLDDLLEHTVERQLGSDGDPCLHERSQTF